MLENSNSFCVLRLNANTFPMSDAERKILSDARLNVCEIEGDNDDEIIANAKKADAVVIVSAYLKAHVIEHLTQCRIISRLGTGFDKIDIEQATKQGIFVTNVPHFSTNEVADHTMALLLSSARRLKEYEALMRKGQRPHSVVGLHRLAVETIGLIGFGRIAKAVAKRAKAFGLNVIAYDPMLTPAIANEEGVTSMSVDELLAKSDYVCLLCPLLDSTREMMGMSQFRKMKPSAVLVNTARGELVNEQELAQALSERIIRYAAIDVYGGINVFEADGFATDHPFFDLDNVTLTPHCSANSEESLMEAFTTGAIAVVDVLAGKRPEYPVNPTVKPWFDIAD